MIETLGPRTDFQASPRTAVETAVAAAVPLIKSKRVTSNATFATEEQRKSLQRKYHQTRQRASASQSVRVKMMMRRRRGASSS